MKKTNDITQEKLADAFKAERPHLLRYACYKLGNEDDAKDVLQDTFLRLHTRIADADDLQINNLRSYIIPHVNECLCQMADGCQQNQNHPIGHED